MSLAASDFVLRYSDTVIEEQISQWTTADEGKVYTLDNITLD